jgi:hypothetical protein
MAMQTQTQEPATLNVKLVHFTKQNSPDEPVQVALHLFQENGWLNIRRGVASIRENRAQRRAMSA